MLTLNVRNVPKISDCFDLCVAEKFAKCITQLSDYFRKRYDACVTKKKTQVLLLGKIKQ